MRKYEKSAELPKSELPDADVAPVEWCRESRDNFEVGMPQGKSQGRDEPAEEKEIWLKCVFKEMPQANIYDAGSYGGRPGLYFVRFEEAQSNITYKVALVWVDAPQESGREPILSVIYLRGDEGFVFDSSLHLTPAPSPHASPPAHPAGTGQVLHRRGENRGERGRGMVSEDFVLKLMAIVHDGDCGKLAFAPHPCPSPYTSPPPLSTGEGRERGEARDEEEDKITVLGTRCTERE
jgi:hypothetical protein